MTQAQISEARSLLGDLQSIPERLTVQDQRFVASWRQYLDRTGAQAQIGSKRLTVLRRIHGCYFPTAQQKVA